MKTTIRPLSAVTLMFTLALSAPISAADLLEVYRDAKAYDATYAAALAARDAGREKLDQGRALILPPLNVSANAARTNLDAHYDPSPLVPPIDRRRFENNGYSLTLTQPIFRRQNFIQYSQADYLVQQSEAVFAGAGQDLILRVAQAYFDVLAAQDTLTLVRAQKAAITEQLAQAKQKFEVVTATITDTHEAQARRDLINSQGSAVQSDLEMKQRTLVQLTGKSYATLDPLRETL